MDFAEWIFGCAFIHAMIVAVSKMSRYLQLHYAI